MSESSSRCEGVYSFMDLPKELRIAVYEAALTVGSITLHCNEEKAAKDLRYTNIAGPHFAPTQLFLVSKYVKEEALPIYLSENHFITSSAPGKDATRLPDGSRWLHYAEEATSNLRSLSVTLDMAYLNERFSEFRQNRISYHPGSYTDQCLFDSLIKDWDDLAIAVRKLSKLQYLEVSVQYCFDPLNDVRSWQLPASCFFRTTWRTAPDIIEFVGFRTDHEANMLKLKLDHQNAMTGTGLVPNRTQILLRLPESTERYEARRVNWM